MHQTAKHQGIHVPKRGWPRYYAKKEPLLSSTVSTPISLNWSRTAGLLFSDSLRKVMLKQRSG
jgi:hypothetical protein